MAAFHTISARLTPEPRRRSFARRARFRLGTPSVWLVPVRSAFRLATLAPTLAHNVSVVCRYGLVVSTSTRVAGSSFRSASSLHRARNLRIARASRCPWPRSAGTSPRLSTRVDGLLRASSRRHRSSSSSSSAVFVVLASSSRSAHSLAHRSARGPDSNEMKVKFERIRIFRSRNSAIFLDERFFYIRFS